MKLALLLAAICLVLAVPSAAADDSLKNPCADRVIGAGPVTLVDGSVCNDWETRACWSAEKCVTLSWCTFCPGPVLW